MKLTRHRRSIIGHVQHREFHKEIRDLKHSGHVGKSSKLAKLVPVLRDNMLRVGGRLKHSGLPDDSVHPLILPQKHSVTRMIVRSLHESNGHIGPRHTLSCLRQKYWIINGLQACKSAVSACIECRRQRQLPMRQQMADLPPERLTPDKPPFAYTCIDFFGPFLVSIKRSRVKRYGCLFSYMTTRAVHLEVTHTLDTDSFSCAFTRFIARRGKPEKVFSDNGTDLVSGSKELRVNIQEFNRKHINDKMLQMDVDWHFNPPHASHMGGVWERLVKSVRTILNTVTRQQTLTDETLITFITEVEGILNSRPTSALSSDSRDLEPLTPNHMLLLKPNGSLPPGVFKPGDNLGVRGWRQIHYLSNVFWRRWVREYLPSLQLREKWQRPHRSVRPNDIVMLIDEMPVLEDAGLLAK